LAGVSGDEPTATTGSASGVTTHDETTTTMRHRCRNRSLLTLRPLLTSNAAVDLIRDDFYEDPSWRIAPRMIIERFRIVNLSALCGLRRTHQSLSTSVWIEGTGSNKVVEQHWMALGQSVSSCGEDSRQISARTHARQPHGPGTSGGKRHAFAVSGLRLKASQCRQEHPLTLALLEHLCCALRQRRSLSPLPSTEQHCPQLLRSRQDGRNTAARLCACVT